MKWFNALQIVVLFAILPFVIQWLHMSADFYGAGAAFWIALVIYVFSFFLITASVAEQMDKW